MESVVKDNSSLYSKVIVLTMAIASSIVCAMVIFCFAGNSNKNQMYICYLGIGVSILVGVLTVRLLIEKSRNFKMLILSKTMFIVFSSLVAIVILTLLKLDTGKTFVFFSSYSLIEHLPDYTFVSIILCTFLLLLYYFTNSKQQSIRFDIPFLAVVGIAIWVVFCYCYHPNIFSEDFYCRHHITAVTHSVYNIYYNAPYTLESSSVYGHYALFIKPILSILGSCTPQIIAVILSLFGVITIVAYAIIVYMITIKRVTKIVSIIAVLVGLKFDATYLQLFPLRFLFPFIILAYLCVFIKKQRILNPIVIGIGYVLCSSGIVWQTDTGVTSLIAYTVSIWICFWRNNKIFTIRSIKLYVITIFCTVFSFFLAFLIVWIYNRSNGVGLSLNVFLFPIINGAGYTDSLYTSIFETGFWICILPVLLFIVALLIGLTNTSVINISDNKVIIFLAIVGLFGLSKCYYYLNRTVAGISCIYPYAILILAIFIELFIKEYDIYTFNGACSVGVSVAGLFLLSIAFTCSLFTSVSAIGISRENAHYETAPVYSVAEKVKENVQPNTFAVGQATQEIYSILNWDPQYHLRDTSDLFGGAYGTMKEAALKQDRVLAEIAVARDISLEDYGYSLEWDNYCNGIVLQYYVREDSRNEKMAR